MKKVLRKRTLAVFACLAIVLAGFAGCGNNAQTQKAADTQKTTLNVFAAASMTESLTKAADQYMAENPNVDVKLNFASSGTLKKQIEQGAECDVFIAAGQKAMNGLDVNDTKVNKNGNDFIAEGTRFNILQNEVVLVVPENNPSKVENFDDLVADLKKGGDFKFAMGNSDVPVGQYTSKILKHFDLDEKALANDGVITYANNVKEVAEQVRSGAVDAGVVYATDAYSQKLTKVASATKDMCGEAIYPAAIMKDTKNRQQADDFVEFLKGNQASADFKEVGFIPLAQDK